MLLGGLAAIAAAATTTDHELGKLSAQGPFAGFQLVLEGPQGWGGTGCC